MQLPDVGESIDLVLDNSFVYGYQERVNAIQKTERVRGTVVAMPKWMAQHADIVILNSDTRAYNYISRYRILSVGGVEAPKAVVRADEVHRVISSKTGEEYTVVKSGRTGKWSCTCVGFQFHKKCRHATRLAEAA